MDESSSMNPTWFVNSTSTTFVVDASEIEDEEEENDEGFKGLVQARRQKLRRKVWPQIIFLVIIQNCYQGLVKGAILCFRNPYFYFRHGESTSTASQITSPASQKSKDLNKVSLLLQDLA